MTVITTERLDLVSMSPAFLECTLHDAQAEAEEILGFKIPACWFENRSLAAARLRQLESGETSGPWLPRAIALRGGRDMIGHIGFHSAPAPAYLSEVSPEAVEFGYTVFPEFRRRGIALEASRGLMNWARREHGVRRFIVSVSPKNGASLALIAKMGFRRIGSQIDDEDGPEDIFELVLNGTDVPSA